MMVRRVSRCVAILASLAAVGRATGQERPHDEQALGKVDFPISCSAPAQAEFNRGIALLHHMTYPRARESFDRVAALDPRCAMTHWGIAMTLFQPLWPTRPTPAALRRGWQEVQRAKELEPPTERERLFVAAAEDFFRDPESTDYWSRLRSWEAAMEKVYTSFPDAAEAAAFYALAHLAVAPADTLTLTHSERAANLLLPVYQKNPDHPGAMHYLVHANDATGRERESPAIVRKYETTAPRNPHALHMPTHIYTRLGEWDAVIRGNLRAAEAALEHPAGERGEFIWDEFPHAIEYLVYAYLQKGDDDRAAAQLRRLHETPRLEPSFKTAFHLASTQARLALERRDWSAAARLAAREPSTLAWDRFPWPEAVIWFAKGLGAARQRNPGDARSAAEQLNRLEQKAAATGEDLFARNIRILRFAVNSWVAQLESDTAVSARLMREAADLELATPKHAVTPAPTLPAHELLGDLYLAQSRATDALAAFQKSLELYPRRFNSLLGAARAARASGNAVVARAYYQQLLDVAGGGTRTAELAEARAAVNSSQD